MMPTRLQDGVSISLLQWMRSADINEKKSVIVRITENESVSDIVANLQNAGMEEFEYITGRALRTMVNSETLSRISRCLGVSAVTEDFRR